MKAATMTAAVKQLRLSQERIGVIRIEGARHTLLWVSDEERAISILLDRPDQGGDRVVRVVGVFRPDEDFEAVEALAGDYEANYVARPRAKRIRPRPLDPDDLAPVSLPRAA